MEFPHNLGIKMFIFIFCHLAMLALPEKTRHQKKKKEIIKKKGYIFFLIKKKLEYHGKSIALSHWKTQTYVYGETASNRNSQGMKH